MNYSLLQFVFQFIIYMFTWAGASILRCLGETITRSHNCFFKISWKCILFLSKQNEHPFTSICMHAPVCLWMFTAISYALCYLFLIVPPSGKPHSFYYLYFMDDTAGLRALPIEPKSPDSEWQTCHVWFTMWGLVSFQFWGIARGPRFPH